MAVTLLHCDRPAASFALVEPFFIADYMEHVQVTAAQGLANQHSVLLSLLTLGMAAGVDRILLPPHMHRSAFTSTAQWEAGPTEALWDVESIRAHVRKGGIEAAGECAVSVQSPSIL